MLSPEWPGRCDGSDMATPWERMQRAKLTKAWSLCAAVGGPVVCVSSR